MRIATQVGLTIEFDDNVWKVMEFLHVKPGKGSAFVRSKLKNLQTGNTLEKTWKAGESFPDAQAPLAPHCEARDPPAVSLGACLQVDKEEMQFSYIDGDEHVFMNMETFEEERILSSDLDKKDFIKDEMMLTVLKWRGKAIDVQVGLLASIGNGAPCIAFIWPAAPIQPSGRSRQCTTLCCA